MKESVSIDLLKKWHCSIHFYQRMISGQIPCGHEKIPILSNVNYLKHNYVRESIEARLSAFTKNFWKSFRQFRINVDNFKVLFRILPQEIRHG